MKAQQLTLDASLNLASDAGNAETSSSGAMSFADTPKGGHFPSGPRSARSFSRTSHHPCTSPTTPKAPRSQNSGQNSRKSRGCGLPPSPRTPRQAFVERDFSCEMMRRIGDKDYSRNEIKPQEVVNATCLMSIPLPEGISVIIAKSSLTDHVSEGV